MLEFSNSSLKESDICRLITVYLIKSTLSGAFLSKKTPAPLDQKSRTFGVE